METPLVIVVGMQMKTEEFVSIRVLVLAMTIQMKPVAMKMLVVIGIVQKISVT